MSVNKHPKWQGWWVIDVSPHGRSGKRERINFEGTKVDAIKIEAEILKKARGGPKIAPTLQDLLPTFLIHYESEKRPLTVKDFLNSWEVLKKDFGGLRTTQITPTHIALFKKNRLEKGVKKRTINKYLSYLSTLVKTLSKHKHAPPTDFDIEGFPLKQTQPPLLEVPTPEDVAALISHARNEQTHLMMSIIYLCGLRIGELPTVCVERIFLDRGYLYVTGKGDKERIVAIPTEELADELAEQIEKVKTGPLFMNPRTGKPIKSIRKSIISAARAAGITQRVYHHLLRHCYGTHSVMAGTHHRTLQELLGHTSMNATNRYIHISGDTLKKEAGKFGSMVATGMARPETKKEVDLKALVWEFPLSKIARDMGISDVAVRKRCLAQGIELPPRGYWQRKYRQRDNVTKNNGNN